MPGRSGSQPAQDALPSESDSPEAESFEATFARLEDISTQLEAGGLTLERAVDLYEEGMRLAERCQTLLASVEQRIETLRLRALEGGGSPER